MSPQVLMSTRPSLHQGRAFFA